MMRTLLDQLQKPGAIRIEFQPIFDVQGGETHLYALEALARGPVGTSLEKPDVLFEYARRKGEESRLDLIVIADLCLSAAGSTEGLEIVRYVRLQCPRARVILLTAFDTPAIEREALRRGADAFLRKPRPLSEIASLAAVLIGDAA